jgi:hypothetical protein
MNMRDRLRVSLALTLNPKTMTRGMVLYGKPALGKSTAVYKAISEQSQKLKVHTFSGKATTVGFWRTISQACEEKADVIVLDDVNLWSTDVMNFLKGITNPVGTPISYADQRQTQTIQCEAAVIVVCNEINPNDPHFEAIKSRCHFLEYAPSFVELHDQLREICEDEASYPALGKVERLEALRLLLKYGAFHKCLNLRCLTQAFDAVLAVPVEAEAVIAGMFETKQDRTLTVVAELQRQDVAPSVRVAEFRRRTGLGRRSYYLKLKTLQKSGQLALKN